MTRAMVATLIGLALAGLLVLPLAALAAETGATMPTLGTGAAGAAGGAVTTAALLLGQQALAWLRSSRAEDQARATAASQVHEARERAAADAALAGRVATLEAGQMEIRAALAGKADADDLARVEAVVTREATEQAKFREALAGRLGELQGEVRTALAAAGRAGT